MTPVTWLHAGVDVLTGARSGLRLSARLSELLGGPTPDRRAGEVFGLEHEYVVRYDGAAVDFRTLVHGIAPSMRGLHPGDPNAYWLPWGALLTADGAEAELALDPTEVRPGFTARLVDRMEAARSWLLAELPPGSVLEGVSTHLSIALPSGSVDRVADEYARGFAVPLMLLLDRPTSPGLLVRPRPGRLELGGEFATYDDLRAAAVFALGSTIALARTIGSGETSPVPHFELSLRAADQRAGWYVDRRAAGDDLYMSGRDTPLRLATGPDSGWTAQDQLIAAWTVARHALRDNVDATELELVDRRVHGRCHLPVERKPGEAEETGPPTLPKPEPSPYGRALGARRRPPVAIAPMMLTWDLAVFVVATSRSSRRAFILVPGSQLGAFLDAFDSGTLDDLLERYLARPGSDRRAPTRSDAGEAGVYDTIDRRVDLLPPEPGSDWAGHAA
jgi:hypothetical protein